MSLMWKNTLGIILDTRVSPLSIDFGPGRVL